MKVSLELLRSVLSKESALTDLDCVDKLLAMIAPILRDPSGGEKGEETTDATMQVCYRSGIFYIGNDIGEGRGFEYFLFSVGCLPFLC